MEFRQSFFVSSLNDELFGEKLILIVEGEKEEYDFSSIDAIQRPKEVYFLDEFKRTENGKVQRKQTIAMLNA